MKYIKLYEKVNEIDHILDSIQNNEYDTFLRLINSTNINYANHEGTTPLMLASWYGRENFVKKLIKMGANINLRDKEKETALISAATMNIIKMLIRAGADWNIKDKINYDFFDYLNDDETIEIIKEFPEEYELYKLKKVSDKYNL